MLHSSGPCMHAHNARQGSAFPGLSRFRGRPAAAAAVSAIANMHIPARLLLRMTAASLRLSGGVSQHQHQAHLQPRHADRRRQHAPASYVKNTPTSGGGKAVLGRVVRAPGVNTRGTNTANDVGYGRIQLGSVLSSVGWNARMRATIPHLGPAFQKC